MIVVLEIKFCTDLIFLTIQFRLSIQFVKHFFQAIQFSQTVLIQTIQFSIGIVFVHTQSNVKIVLFQTIQFSIRIVSGATIMGQSGPGSDGNEVVLHILQSSCITETSPSDCLVFYPGHSFGRRSYPSAGVQSVYFTAPAEWARNCNEFTVGKNLAFGYLFWACRILQLHLLYSHKE